MVTDQVNQSFNFTLKLLKPLI